MTSSLGPLRVLVLDDSAADADLALAELLRSGMDVRCDIVLTPADFTLRAARCPYDVVISDFRMPGWTGLDALAALRASGSDAPLIVVTGTLGDESAVELVKQGVSDYVLKDNLSRLPLVVIRSVQESRARRERAVVEQQFTQLAENIAEVFFVVDANFTKAFFVNKAYETVFGRSCESVYDNPQSFLDAVHPDDATTLRESSERIRRGEEGGQISFRVVRDDGEVRWLLSRAVGIRDTQGRVDRISGLALDVTEHRNLEERFLAAQKMEAIGRLAGGVAHDFNNLLTVITSYTTSMLGEVSADHPFTADLEEIMKAADAAAQLTRQLLMFSRRTVVQPRVVEVEQVVSGAQRMLARVIGEDIALEIVTSGRPCAVRIDPGQLEQVIMNLVVNARDAMPQGGVVRLETDVVSLDAAAVSGPWHATPGRFARLTSSDTGCGMDLTTQAKAFDPFFTTKEAGKGTGLGLATVYGIVKGAGGLVTVSSAPGHGATFCVYLPLTEDTPEALVARAAEPPISRAAVSVLVVDDSAAVRTAVRRSLERYGYEVLAADSGTSALSIAAQHPGPIALLLTDVVMPRMSGRELAEQFSALRPHAKILYTSGYTDDSVVRHGVMESSVAFIQKPFTPQDLHAKVREVLSRD